MLSLTELESLRDEFIRFLVVNGIDALQWEEMKSNDPVGYGAWLEKFSDLVMDDVLTKVQYIDHYESGKYRIHTSKHVLNVWISVYSFAKNTTKWRSIHHRSGKGYLIADFPGRHIHV